MTPAERLSRLLDCVMEQAREIDPRGFHLGRYKGWLKLRADFEQLPGVSLNAGTEDEPVWLRVERCTPEPPPPLPDAKLKNIIRIPTEPDGPPPSVDEALLARRTQVSLGGKTPEQIHAFETQVSVWVSTALAEYLTSWSIWADEERRRRRSVALYGELFALKHQLDAVQTAQPMELVWGLGVSAWQLPGTDISVQYPLITQRMELVQEPQSLALLLRPRTLPAQLEFDAWAAARLPAAAELEQSARAALAALEKPPSPFDASGYAHVLHLVAGGLHERGNYQPELDDALPEPSAHLVVSHTWALWARPRSNHFLHEDIRRLKQQLAEPSAEPNAAPGASAVPTAPAAHALPAGALALVTPPADQLRTAEPMRLRGLSGESRPAAGRSGPVHELYFPLAYNAEQVSIVELLESSSGVAVQGPPGTGKTHTIANIVCHYLAQGRRVLVTSKGEKALEVLQAKIPESVRALTVALLAGDREGLRQFQASIETITHTITQIDPQALRGRISSLHSDIHRAHSELSLLDRRVDAIAQAQLLEQNLDGQPLRAQDMAERVSQGAARYAWFTDRPSLAPEHTPPLDAMDTAKLREVRRLLGPDLPTVSAGLPSSASLPSPAELTRLHEALQALQRLQADEAQGELPRLLNAEPATLEAARQLLTRLETLLPQVQALQAAADPWPKRVREHCAQPELAGERAALEALFPEMQDLVRERAEFLKRPVELPLPDEHWANVRQAVQRGAQSGKPFGLMHMLAGDEKERVAHIRVAGLPPSSTEEWAHAARYLGLHDRALSFAARWNAIAEPLALPALTGGLAALRQIDRLAAGMRPAHHLAQSLDAPLPGLLQQVFAQPPRLAPAPDAVALVQLMNQLRRHLARADWQRAAAQRAALCERFQLHLSALGQSLHELFEHMLGQPELNAELLRSRYAELLGQYQHLEGLAPAFNTLNALAARIAQAGAPQWAERLRQESAERAGEDPLVPADWREAWNWARLAAHLDSVDAHTELRALAQRRRLLEQTLAKRYEEVVAQSAWLATRLGATPKVLSALAQYQTAVRLIGKGTGVNAARYRRDAQQAMQEAQAAVPCWIMSHSKVSEMLPAELGGFDLVIVDEASQSDLWALPAVLRGDKLLVVGDDKQVSPEAGGFLATHRAQELRERFLADQPHASVLTPTHSLYDMASSVFAASKVMLREHFRCVAPIIAYSNHTFYQDAIQPLRLPTADQRLDPPLIDLYVPSGRRDGRDINHDEACAIAEHIAGVLADARCAGRSLGVVSLLGYEQARYIDQRVRERCDAAELQRRQFECGDARLFQGSERDIMYLSLVASPGDCKALSGNVFEQRFNVAASRARDRMVLVRSVQRSDLSAADLRQSLLAHFSPETVPTPTVPAPTELEPVAAQLLALCESGFEREVLGVLLAQGYRVQPQVKAGSYRLDMVVEGEQDRRLAIECDGDEFHGPDRWAADMHRQRVLERAGWRFWRCFASTWRRRNAEVVADLFATLAEHGIQPLGGAGLPPSAVEQQVWLPPK